MDNNPGSEQFSINTERSIDNKSSNFNLIYEDPKNVANFASNQDHMVQKKGKKYYDFWKI